jgi:hypothetical protein
VLPLIGRAERVAFDQLRAQIQSALLLEAAERITRGESSTLVELAARNPMELLLTPPGNYVGSFSRSRPARDQRRVWYFDASQGLLVYRPGRRADFRALDGPEDRIELAVRFIFEDRNQDGAYQPGVDEFAGLRLAAVAAYEWGD